jgi:hypothetical protein
MTQLLRLFFLAAFAFMLVPAIAQQTPTAQKASKPVIALSTVPQRDVGGPDKMAVIAGTVQGAPKDSRIVIFAHGDIWYVQPYAASPFTRITDGRFQADTHLGTQYAVLVVRPSYRPPSTTGDLPDEGGDILAIKIVAGR